MNTIQALIFDASGTLLNVEAAMLRHSDRNGLYLREISADGQARQIDDSLAVPSDPRQFWRPTRDVRTWASAPNGLRDPDVLAEALTTYRHLDASPDEPVVSRPARNMRPPHALQRSHA